MLPNDLPNAVKQLRDDELERLLAAALAEQRRRGKKQEKSALGKRHADLVGLALTPSKINAVRAAFKAGIKPAQIARQFGISRPDVQKVLATGRD